MQDHWNPEQYERFKAEREMPFWDLVSMVQPCAFRSVVDLGCGTGKLTRDLHQRLQSKATLGVDSSASMLEGCMDLVEPGLQFAEGEISTFEPASKVDLVFSNAALHWLDDHPGLFARFAGWLTDEGQIAIGVPANFDHRSHLIAARLVREEPFAVVVGDWKRGNPVSAPEAYAELLDELGFVEQRVQLNVYPHQLDSVEDLIEWQKGTLLTVYREQLGDELYELFLERFGAELRKEMGGRQPLFYPFKRILIWGRRGQGN